MKFEIFINLEGFSKLMNILLLVSNRIFNSFPLLLLTVSVFIISALSVYLNIRGLFFLKETPFLCVFATSLSFFTTKLKLSSLSQFILWFVGSFSFFKTFSFSFQSSLFVPLCSLLFCCVSSYFFFFFLSAD
uniref:Uncharacterized protein n=1 Tax=Cacopsylla melanoneura TaxID=428564 RepID=A0A8D8VD15_9HEMI